MRGVDGFHEFTGEVMARGPNAILFKGDTWDLPYEHQGFWVSVRHKDFNVEVHPHDRDEPATATVVVPDWWAKKNGVADYE